MRPRPARHRDPLSRPRTRRRIRATPLRRRPLPHRRPSSRRTQSAQIKQIIEPTELHAASRPTRHPWYSSFQYRRKSSPQAGFPVLREPEWPVPNAPCGRLQIVDWEARKRRSRRPALPSGHCRPGRRPRPLDWAKARPLRQKRLSSGNPGYSAEWSPSWFAIPRLVRRTLRGE